MSEIFAIDKHVTDPTDHLLTVHLTTHNSQHYKYSSNKMHSTVKDEPVDYDSDPWCHRQDEEEEQDPNLVPCPLKQLLKLKYPPGCPVRHMDFTTKELSCGYVSKAFFRLDNKGGHLSTDGIVYRLACGLSFPEEHMQFGRGATVWASLPGRRGDEQVASVVLSVYYPSGDQEPLYSVQVDDSKAVHHFIPSESIRYRDANVSMIPPIITEDQSTRNFVSLGDHLHHIDDASEETVVETARPLSNTEHSSNMPVRPTPLGVRWSPPAKEDQRTLTPGSNTDKRRALSPAPSRLSKEDEDNRARKRQRHRPNLTCHNIVLPKWYPVNLVKELFYGRAGAAFEEETRSNMTLRGSCFESDPRIRVKIYITIECEKSNFELIMRRIEEMMMARLDNIDERRLLTYDIASDNHDNCRRTKQELTKNRPRIFLRPVLPLTVTMVNNQHVSVKKFMCVVRVEKKFPGTVDTQKSILLRNFGIYKMIGQTDCFVRVFTYSDHQQRRVAIYIEGNSFEAVQTSAELVFEHLHWAGGVLSTPNCKKK